MQHERMHHIRLRGTCSVQYRVQVIKRSLEHVGMDWQLNCTNADGTADNTEFTSLRTDA